MGIFNDIQNGLNNKLASIPLVPVVFYPNTNKEPKKGEDFIRPTLMPAQSVANDLNGKDQHIGIYQIDIYTQLKKGTSVALTIADQIRLSFKNQDIVVNSNIIHITNISVSRAERDESWWYCFVEVNYFVVA